MSEATDRLERYLTEVEGRGAGAVDERLTELDGLETRAGEGADAAVATFAALAGDTRYRLVRALTLADRPLCVCELHPLLEVSESAVSHALADLAEVGLVEGEGDGRWRRYEATARAERLVAAALPDDAGGGGV